MVKKSFYFTCLVVVTLAVLVRADPEVLACDSSAPYRSLDGTCNNLANPYLGVGFDQGPDGILDVYNCTTLVEAFPGGPKICLAATQIDAGRNAGIFRRTEPNEFNLTLTVGLNRVSLRDGVTTEAVAGIELLRPGPVSVPRAYSKANLLFTYLGQLLAHDYAETAGPPINPFVASPNKIVGLPILNPFTGNYSNVSVILGSPTYDVFDANGVPQPFNNATAYLDLSMIYGPITNVTMALRSMTGGLLRTLGNKTFTYTAKNVPNRDLCDCTLTLVNGTQIPYMKLTEPGFDTFAIMSSTTSGFSPERGPAPFFSSKCYSADPFGNGTFAPLVFGCSNPVTGGLTPFQPKPLNVSCTWNAGRATDGTHNSFTWNVAGSDTDNEWQPLASDVSDAVTTDLLLALTKDRSHIFAAGDPRNVENFAILVLHNLFLREHNRKARELAAANPDWNDEKLFQEARKWCIALWQKIIHKEYVPYLVGRPAYAHSSLSKPYAFVGYDETRDPRIGNLFSTAATRFGHSMVPNAIYPLHPSNFTRVVSNQKQLYRHFFGVGNPGVNNNWLNLPGAGQINGFALVDQHLAFMKGHLDSAAKPDDAILAGLLVQKSQKVDRFVEQSIGEFQIASCFTPFSVVGVPAITVFRGRTHGLPNYHKVREIYSRDSLYNQAGCMSLNATHDTLACFTSLIGDVAYATKLWTVYKRLTNIDPFIGMIIEAESFSPEDSLVGNTASRVIIEEFENIRSSDRFWYESDTINMSNSERGKLNGMHLLKLLAIHHPALADKLALLEKDQIFDGTESFDPVLNP